MEESKRSKRSNAEIRARTFAKMMEPVKTKQWLNDLGKKKDIEKDEKEKDMKEGYRVLPPMPDMPDPIPGLEGPWRMPSGRVVYYDPSEGRYYDRSTDMYLSHEEADAMQHPELYREFAEFMGRQIQEEPKYEWKELEAYLVPIPANVYAGKYYDFRTYPYFVIKGEDGVETPEDAVQWVLNNKDKVLDKFQKARQNGRRIIMNPVEKNTFFDKIPTHIIKQTKIQRKVPVAEMNEAEWGNIDNETYFGMEAENEMRDALIDKIAQHFNDDVASKVYKVWHHDLGLEDIDRGTLKQLAMMFQRLGFDAIATDLNQFLNSNTMESKSAPWEKEGEWSKQMKKQEKDWYNSPEYKSSKDKKVKESNYPDDFRGTPYDREPSDREMDEAYDYAVDMMREFLQNNKRGQAYVADLRDPSTDPEDHEGLMHDLLSDLVGTGIHSVEQEYGWEPDEVVLKGEAEKLVKQMTTNMESAGFMDADAALDMKRIQELAGIRR